VAFASWASFFVGISFLAFARSLIAFSGWLSRRSLLPVLFQSFADCIRSGLCAARHLRINSSRRSPQIPAATLRLRRL